MFAIYQCAISRKKVLEMERWDGAHSAVIREMSNTSCAKESEGALGIATALPLHSGLYQSDDHSSGSAASRAVPKWQPRPSPQAAAGLLTGLALPEATATTETTTTNGALTRARTRAHVPVVVAARYHDARLVPSAAAVLLAPLPARAVPAAQRDSGSDIVDRARGYHPLPTVAPFAASRDTHCRSRAPNEKRNADMCELGLPSERHAVRILQQLARLKTLPRGMDTPNALHADVLEYALFPLSCFFFPCAIFSFFSFFPCVLSFPLSLFSLLCY